MDQRTNGMTPPESASTGRIEAEIAQTRTEMRETINAIQERLAPDQVLQRAKDTAREAAVGRVRQMAHDLGDRASGMTANARTVAEQTARDNPMPLALIGIGIGWLLARSLSGNRRHTYYDGSAVTDWSDDPWSEEWSGGQRQLSREGDSGPGTTERAKQMMESTRNRMRDVTSRGRQSMTSAARGTQGSLDRALNDNPLALGVATLAAGLAVGAMMPRTHVEDEYLGTTRDSMMHKAQSAMEQATGAQSQASSGPTA
jgi:ElaB/YqjD/DUF883 family membrane-anchored ribosome-binding protein